MRSRMACVAFLAALVAGGFSVAEALAQTQTPAGPAPVTRKTPPKPKAPARVTVQKRSFLDAGTEVLPGQRHFSDYAFPPGYSATQPIDYTSANILGPHGGLGIDPVVPSRRPWSVGW
jgi:hypothetical protein